MNLSMNTEFNLDQTEAESESPMLMPKPDVPVTVWVGANERPVFLDQARWLAEAWNATHVIDPNRHHFDVIDGLIDSNSALINALFT
jgi:pimeloyl-ACP methyl ester carboxylesterase